MSPVPAVVIAAPASGSGKTTVSTGLIGALRTAGHRVAPFKVGPDYIDPGYHAVAAGVVGRNLDPNLVGTDVVAPLFAAGTAGADIAVVEGVMGLFDGRILPDDADGGPSGFGSTAHVAQLIGAPVVLVVDAAGHSQSLAALLQGFVGYDPSIHVAGVVLNRVGSDRHETVLRQACARAGLPVFGVLRRDPHLQVPSRHLGLIPAAERRDDAVRAVAAMATTVGAALDLPAIVAAARSRGQGPVDAWSAADAVATGGSGSGSGGSGARRPIVAVAGGAAFTFGYAEHSELLTAAGADVVGFDPLNDPLPPGTDAVVVGGGFPEEHAEVLSANEPLRTGLAAHARAGRPILAECAGLLYLATELDGHPMAGVLDVVGRFGPTLTLGYRDGVAVADSVAFVAGERVTGHEFHRSTVEAGGEITPAWAWRDHQGSAGTHGFVQASVHASYLHVHPAGHPAAVTRFVSAARRAAEVTGSGRDEAAERTG
ncbi:cobyrinate a,c-diamide synthase [Gordonia hankookensis]|uniref:Hydrogenobyrinate a,c-diamide synthase n=1 Tax=Gordonia hankookensis TaxID=589403 RepID=A0ABR7WGA2_9ACTN|nr:cobyrinate a,c-diamide synthase [Gordonia hankookensis]MBD1321720.1 cobyrinate a,c-diamide synthase [Gordonia hankookensis]